MRTKPFHSLISLIALAIGLSFGAATASATVYEGSFSDVKGDGSSPDRDITAAALTYDNEAGTLRFTIDLAAAHTSSPVQIATGIGTISSNGICSIPLAVVGSLQPDGVVKWAVENDGNTGAEATGDGAIDIQGSKITLDASATELRGLTPDCGEAVLSNEDASVTFDSTNAFAVAPRPKRPNLGLSLKAPGKVKPRGTAKVKVTIKNSGDGAANGAKLSVTAKGGKIKPQKIQRLKIPAGKSVVRAFKVKAGRKGKVKLRAKVSLRGSSAGAGKVIAVKKPRKKPKPPKPGGSLAGKIFWGFEEYQWDQSSDILGLYFSNSKFVHWGMPKGGLPNCSRVTAKVDEDGEMQPGCLRYSYNPKSGKITIGKAKGTYRKGDLKLKMDSDMWRIDGKTWYPGAFAKAGARFKVTLINRGYYGLCGITAYCQTWAEYLTLEPGGKFGRTRSSLTTSGGGSLPFIAVGNYPPEDRGTYEVLSNGRIRFNYDNGETGVETLTIQTDKKGRPDAANEGLLLDDIWFYKEDEDE